MKRQGSCHCKAIQFEVDTDLAQVMRCNCSMYGRSGTLMTFVPAAQHRVTRGEEHYVSYRFGPEKVNHGFCRLCGIRPFSTAQGEHGPMAMINVGCLEGVDTRDYADAMVYDGASL